MLTTTSPTGCLKPLSFNSFSETITTGCATDGLKLSLHSHSSFKGICVTVITAPSGTNKRSKMDSLKLFILSEQFKYHSSSSLSTTLNTSHLSTLCCSKQMPVQQQWHYLCYAPAQKPSIMLVCCHTAVDRLAQCHQVPTNSFSYHSSQGEVYGFTLCTV